MCAWALSMRDAAAASATIYAHKRHLSSVWAPFGSLYALFLNSTCVALDV
jgi:hypothetical protein